MTEKIISFPGAEPLPDNPLTVERGPLKFCNHDRITLDEHRRTARPGLRHLRASFQHREAQSSSQAFHTVNRIPENGGVPSMTENKILVPASEAAQMLSMGESTFWRKVSQHKLPQPVKIAGMTRWRVTDLQQHVERLATLPTTA